MGSPDDNRGAAATAETESGDDEVHRLICSELNRNFLIEAAAGAGKTTVLVERIVEVLATGRARVNRIAVVTFTEKAAGELRLKLRNRLEAARLAAALDSQRNQYLFEALSRLEEAKINTIHGFCSDILHAYPLEAGVAPRFEVLAEGRARRLFEADFDLWLRQRLEHPPEGIRRAMARAAFGEDGAEGRVRAAAWQLAQWRDCPALWRRDGFDAKARICACRDLLERFALSSGSAARSSDPLFVDTQVARDVWQRLSGTGRDPNEDRDEAELVDLARGPLRRARDGNGVSYSQDLSRIEVIALRDRLVEALKCFADDADADLAARLQAELWETVGIYQERKRSGELLDFEDLVLCTRTLLRDDAAARIELSKRFDALFVDEFQDTDPLQAEILLLLSAEDATVADWRAVQPAPGKLFVVGDPQQSIYRFRRAEIGVYEQVKERIAASGGRCVRLCTSYRATPGIQAVVNAAFGPLMDGDVQTRQASFIPLGRWRSHEADQPEVVVLPVPAPYGTRSIALKEIERSLPDAIGAFVDWLLAESSWTVCEGAMGNRVPIAARHVCILFRRFSSRGEDVTRPYAQALVARSVPHLLVGGRSYHLREEVESIRVAFAAIERPDDELSVFAALRGSLFALPDAELFAYQRQFSSLNPRTVPEKSDGPFSTIIDALTVLRNLHAMRDQRTVGESLRELLAAVRAHAGFMLRPSGEQVLANVLHIAELAHAFEAAGGGSFSDFVDEMNDAARRGEAPEASILEEGSDGVRMMTVHRAKGLEFPVVILADMTARLARGQADRFVDLERSFCAQRLAGWAPAELLENESLEVKRDAAEGVRVAYVAATRARDLLVIPALGDQKFSRGWLQPLNEAIYPETSRWTVATPAHGVSVAGEVTVLNRPESECDTPQIRSGSHIIGTSDKYSVIWWGLSSLVLNAYPRYGIRQKELLGQEPEPNAVANDAISATAWLARRESMISAASGAERRVLTATIAADCGLDLGGEVEIIELPVRRNRPFGVRWGQIIHELMATAVFNYGSGALTPLANLVGRRLGASMSEIEHAVDAVTVAMEHPVMIAAGHAVHAGNCQAEVPVVLHLVGGQFIAGVVDLAYYDGDCWVVVDFKTDLASSDARSVYERQVRLYRHAIEQATGVAGRSVLFFL